MANAIQFDFTAFRNNLHSLIESRGLSINSAADLLGISPSTLSRYQKGIREPDLCYVVQIADYFHVSVDWLIGRSEDLRGRMTDEVYDVAHLYSIATEDDRSVIQAVLNKYRASDE